MAVSRARAAVPILLSCGRHSSSGNAAVAQFSRQVFRRHICLSAQDCSRNPVQKPESAYTQEFIQKQIEEYNIGKRHLANIMGEDPENFSQEDIDRSIAYLFPSGLFEKKARPQMKHPEDIFPKQRAVQWDKNGRPFHFLFYTGRQSYYSLMHDVYAKMLLVEKHQDQLRAKGLLSTEAKQTSLVGSRWFTKEELEAALVENISPQQYERFIQLMERLVSLPCWTAQEQTVMTYRQQLEAKSSSLMVAPLQKDEKGVTFSSAEGARKTARATVVLRDSGSGLVVINGRDLLLYFPVLQDREQLMFPLQFTGLLGRFDLEASVSGGGRSSQAGALRLALSRALLSFVSEGEREEMRQAGLLTQDPRIRERKKPGQEGARRKFAWNRR